MKARELDLLSKVFDRNTATGAFIVKTALKEYSDIFSDVDASPIRKRDLDSAYLDYFIDCSEDIPLRYKLELQFLCPGKIQDCAGEGRVKDGLGAYCNIMMLTLSEKIRKSYRKSIGYILVFIILVSSAYGFDASFHKNVFTETLQEGIFVGAWVFMWEAFVILFLNRRDEVMEYKRYERLEKSKVEFRYL